jgi:hypothetical protein
MAGYIGDATAERSRMTTTGKAGHGPVEATVAFGVVCCERRRAMLAPICGIPLGAETWGRCGRLELHIRCPERLVADLGREV